MLNDPQEERDPDAIHCPNPQCKGGQIFNTANVCTGWCDVCDGATIMTGDDMWTALAWAEERDLPVQYAELSREDLLDD